MMFATSEPDARDRVRAAPNAIGYCPCCKSRVYPKCGAIVQWHWAHLSGDCDLWHELETEWHREWKDVVPEDQQEIVMMRDGVIHRADVVTASGVVVEFQHSSISPEDIYKRETFYQRMVWLFDATEAIKLRVWNWSNEYSSGEASKYPLELFPKKGLRDAYDFTWSWPRKSIVHCGKPVYLDLGRWCDDEEEVVFSIKELRGTSRLRGWGVLRHRWEFADWVKRPVAQRVAGGA